MVKCDSCDQEFGHENSLEQHRQAKHSSGEKTSNSIKYGKGGGKLKYGLLALVIVAVVGGFFAFTNQSQGVGSTGDFLAQNAPVDISYALAEYNSKNQLHWHPELTIRINGQAQIIPANIGLTPTVHQPVHTHETDNVLHWEIFPPKTPTEQNMRLGYFFQIWGRKFNSQCILDSCGNEEKSVKMFVNSQPNTDFENYLVHDGDKIEIEYS